MKSTCLLLSEVGLQLELQPHTVMNPPVTKVLMERTPSTMKQMDIVLLQSVLSFFNLLQQQQADVITGGPAGCSSPLNDASQMDSAFDLHCTLSICFSYWLNVRENKESQTLLVYCLLREH